MPHNPVYLVRQFGGHKQDYNTVFASRTDPYVATVTLEDSLSSALPHV